MKIILIIYLIFYCFHDSVYWYTSIEDETNVYDWIDAILWLLTIYFPGIISQLCCSVMFLKYQLFLRGLMDELDENTDKSDYDIFSAMRKQYQSAINQFKKDGKFWEWYIGLLSIDYFLFVWIYSDEIIHEELDTWQILHHISGVIFYAIPLIEFVLSASNIRWQYHQLQNKVFHLLDDQIDQEFGNINENISSNDLQVKLLKFKSHQILCNHVKSNKLCVVLFGWTISTKTALQLFVFFVVTKVITYSIYHLQ